MTTFSHTPKGDNMEEVQQVVNANISHYESQKILAIEVVQTSLENKLTSLEDTLKDYEALLSKEGNQRLEQHIRIAHEEFLYSILSHQQQPPFSHGHKPPLMDNNIWHCFQKWT